MSKAKSQPDGPNPGDPHPPSRGEVPGTEDMLALARRVTEATGCPVVGGLAVVLHGWGRYTRDIDIYSTDFKLAHTKLLAAGIEWNAKRREHVINGVPIHMVGEDSLGGPATRPSTIRGVKVIRLVDLIRGKLTVGLDNIDRGKDVVDVIELIRIIPLKKDFAARLPRHLQAPFQELVEQVHGPRRSTLSFRAYFKKHGGASAKAVAERLSP
jgi:hypothetical protein